MTRRRSTRSWSFGRSRRPALPCARERAGSRDDWHILRPRRAAEVGGRLAVGGGRPRRSRGMRTGGAAAGPTHTIATTAPRRAVVAHASLRCGSSPCHASECVHTAKCRPNKHSVPGVWATQLVDSGLGPQGSERCFLGRPRERSVSLSEGRRAPQGRTRGWSGLKAHAHCAARTVDVSACGSGARLTPNFAQAELGRRIVLALSEPHTWLWPLASLPTQACGRR